MGSGRRPRPVLVAPDKFKGTIAATEVAEAVARGLARAGIAADRCPVADGGEGTLELLVEHTGGEYATAGAHDALGRPLEARFGLLDGGTTALVEVAQAIGLARIEPHERDAWAASSRGAGELIAAAAATGAREVVVAVGGTASTDGGAGAVAALREAGLAGRRRRGAPALTVICDVRAAWEQAAPLFAPQKGADEATVRRLARRLATLAAGSPKPLVGRSYTGAGGGLAGGLWAHARAELRSGAAYVLDRLDFNARMTAARAVVTGEGRLDRQTLLGKAVAEVATRARQAGVPCHAIAGTVAMNGFEARVLDLESVAEAGDRRAIAAAAARLAPVLAPT